MNSFHKTWQDFFLPKVFRKEKFTLSDANKIPQFSFIEEPINKALMQVVFAIIGLIIPTTIAFLISMNKLNRYSIAEG